MTVFTDNVATSYFQTQPKLSPKQARWQEFLADFDLTLKYKPGRDNSVADALSRRPDHAQLAATQAEAPSKGSATRPTSALLDRIRQGIEEDPTAKELLQQAREGRTRQFWAEDGLIFTKGRRLFVPRWDGLRRQLLKECHDTEWAGHPGQRRTLALLEMAYYWPHMGDDVEEYVRTCIICQQDKVEHSKPAGLLQPLPVPTRPWESVSLDFISALPQVGGCGSILVVVDRFSKYATFIPAPTPCNAEDAAHLFVKNVVKLWGVPENIVSDRDPRFTDKFWTKVFHLLGIDLLFSTSSQP